MTKGDRIKVIGGSTGAPEFIGKEGAIICKSSEIGYDVRLDDIEDIIYLREIDIEPLIKFYNATKHWQEGTIDMVEDALVRGGFKYRMVYFDDNGSLQIEKERE